MGDMLMHSLDTVKTRQQGDPHMPPKYTSMGSTYRTIWKQEGVSKGLYGGALPALLGSFSGTCIFFGTYEFGKRALVDMGVNPTLAYFSAGTAPCEYIVTARNADSITLGFMADLAASPLYVPSEVLKTRLQLQGRHNNPYFHSGYNYKSMTDAFRTIVRVEGVAEMFSGYKATLCRDLPFSALQFAFYEQEQKWAKSWVGSKEIGLPLEIITGASAGGLAGIITCPMDVVKTRIQTQLDEPPKPQSKTGDASKSKTHGAESATARSPPRPATASSSPSAAQKGAQALRHISTSGASTALRQHGSVKLETESVIQGLRVIYKAEGLGGWFRGVGPRAVWTSIQSGCMLVMYQQLLKWFDAHPLVDMDNDL